VSEPTRLEQRGAGRVYADDRIEVRWEPRLCIHTRSCVRRLGRVFDPERCGGSANKPLCDGTRRRTGFEG
jgi:hypothetical protein